MPYAGRLFVHTREDPHRLAAPIARVIREMSADQPVERAATLADVRAELLAPERLNAFVFSGFAGVALLIAVVGVAGVLAFSVSARTREFGVRLAVGSSPWRLLAGVLAEGVLIVTMGVVAGAAGGYVLGRRRRGLARQHATARRDDSPRRRGHSHRRGRDRLDDAGRARVARRRSSGAAVRVAPQTHPQKSHPQKTQKTQKSSRNQDT